MSIPFFLATLVACTGSSEPEAKPQPPQEAPAAAAPAEADDKPADHAATVQHGDPGAEPGSHADWCGEHAVPESTCTRCNASLIPAFKATGDWCGEHGLPESQCLACNPELVIERPPKAG